MFDWWGTIHNSYANGITFFDDIGIFIAFGTFMFTLINWLNNRKQNKDITIELRHGEQSKQLDVTIKRRHLTRSEVLGVLGAIYQGAERYDIPFLAQKAFFTRLELAQEGKTSALCIDIDDITTFNDFFANTANGL